MKWLVVVVAIIAAFALGVLLDNEPRPSVLDDEVRLRPPDRYLTDREMEPTRYRPRSLQVLGSLTLSPTKTRVTLIAYKTGAGDNCVDLVPERVTDGVQLRRGGFCADRISGPMAWSSGGLIVERNQMVNFVVGFAKPPVESIRLERNRPLAGEDRFVSGINSDPMPEFDHLIGWAVLYGGEGIPVTVTGSDGNGRVVFEQYVCDCS